MPVRAHRTRCWTVAVWLMPTAMSTATHTHAFSATHSQMSNAPLQLFKSLVRSSQPFNAVDAFLYITAAVLSYFRYCIGASIMQDVLPLLWNAVMYVTEQAYWRASFKHLLCAKLSPGSCASRPLWRDSTWGWINGWSVPLKKCAHNVENRKACYKDIHRWIVSVL